MLNIDDVPSLLRTHAVHEPDPVNRNGMDAALRRLVGLHPTLANLTNL
jgi:hypothetical protein